MNWIPVFVKKKPKAGEYALLSFSNFTIPEVGRFENGEWYIGDEERPIREIGILVNAWMPLPKPYRGTL